MSDDRMVVEAVLAELGYGPLPMADLSMDEWVVVWLQPRRVNVPELVSKVVEQVTP